MFYYLRGGLILNDNFQLFSLYLGKGLGEGMDPRRYRVSLGAAGGSFLVSDIKISDTRYPRWVERRSPQPSLGPDKLQQRIEIAEIGFLKGRDVRLTGRSFDVDWIGV